MNRRKFLTGLGAGVIAAPAIVSIANIMPVRNRLFVPAPQPASQLYTVPTDYTFSCYLKPAVGTQWANNLLNAWESLTDVGNGWKRYSTQFSAGPGESATLKLPVEHCWGAQLEALRGPLNLELRLEGPNGDGLVILPTSDREWPNPLKVSFLPTAEPL